MSGSFYLYDPNLGLAYSSMIIFAIFGAILLYFNIMNPPHKFMHVLVFAALGETVGFAIRIYSTTNTTMLVFIATTLFLLLMPNFIALANYIACGRLMAFSNLKVGFLRPTWLAKIFFISDILSFGVQGMGGGLLASTDSKSQTLGKTIIIIGLVLQSIALALFLWVTITIHTQPRYNLAGRPDAELMFKALYITTALLFVRSIFRLVEYAAGRTSYLQTKEWPFYVFDTLAIFVAFVVYASLPMHFGRCLNALKAEIPPLEPDAADTNLAVIVSGNQVAPEAAEDKVAEDKV